MKTAYPHVQEERDRYRLPPGVRDNARYPGFLDHSNTCPHDERRGEFKYISALLITERTKPGMASFTNYLSRSQVHINPCLLVAGAWLILSLASSSGGWERGNPPTARRALINNACLLDRQNSSPGD